MGLFTFWTGSNMNSNKAQSPPQTRKMGTDPNPRASISTLRADPVERSRSELCQATQIKNVMKGLDYCFF
jgi:hypothetical protein